MVWRWLQPEDGTQILTYDPNWPMLTFGGQCLYMGWVGQPLIVVFGQGYHSICTHGQVKRNSLLSHQLLLCFSLYLQSTKPPHLVAIRSSYCLLYTHRGYRYHFFRHWGLICRKIPGICDFEVVRDLAWNHPAPEMPMIWDTEQ